MTNTAKIHPFEAAGLGVAPFRCVGVKQIVKPGLPGEPALPGGSCDYCGTGIKDAFEVRSSDGREFVVGCDCIRKAYAEFDATIPPEFRREIARLQRQKRDAKYQVRANAAADRAAAARAILEADPTLFVDRPHPHPYFASQGKTRRDYLDYMLGGGIDGRTAAAIEIERERAANINPER